MFTLYQTAFALEHEPHPKGLLFYSRGSRGGPLPLLVLDQTEARRAEKIVYGDRPPPPPLSQGLDLFPLPPPPPPRYLKVWIHHWLTHKNGDFGPKRSEAALRRSRICSVPHFGAMWTGIRNVAEVNKWEGELELAETEVNIYSGVRIGISSLYPIRPTAPFQFCAVAVLTILDSYVVGVGTKTHPV